MRIKSGGPQKSTGPQGTAKTTTSAAKGARFAGMVKATGDATEQPSQGKDAMMAALQALAADVESGKTTQEEASRRFVGLVLETRFALKRGKGTEKMEESISELVDADPQFVSKLQSQLKRIAKS
jgi:hypothetical protein